MSGSKVDVKVVLLGKEYGGKTSLVERYLNNRFSGDLPYQNTIGAAYGAKRVHVFGRSVVLGIWDTAGSERYQAMSRIYYRDAKAALICYDITDMESFEKAKFWLGELRANEPSCLIYFVGTKADTEADVPGSRNVALALVEDFAQQYSAQVFETSSKTGENVDEVFLTVAKDFVKNAQNAPPSQREQGIVLEDKPPTSIFARIGGVGDGEKKAKCCGTG